MGPRPRTLPGLVALELVLAQTDRFAICISRLAAYSTGFEFDIHAFAAPGQDEADLPDPLFFGPMRHPARRTEPGLSPDLLRMGVQFSDGRKATKHPGLPSPHG